MANSIPINSFPLNSLNSANLANISSKNKLTQSEKYYARKDSYDKFCKKQTKVQVAACLGGTLAGVIGGLISKNSQKGCIIGITASLLSGAAGLVALRAKENKKSKEFYQKFENNEENKGLYDKFLGKIARPLVVDFGDEEKNKEYYQKEKARLKKQNTVELAAFGIFSVATLVMIAANRKGNKGVESFVEQVADFIDIAFWFLG